MTRLVAASTGATPQQQAAIKSLAPEEGLDYRTVWAALGMARRLGTDDTAHVKLIREQWGAYAELALAFADGEAVRQDIPGATARLEELPFQLRGHASVLAVVLVGDDAPQKWIADANRLLFASERPWLGTPKPD